MKTSFTPCVVGLGELLWDELPDGRRPGGAPANFACHATALGARGVAVSAVGDDASGRALLGWLAGVGIDPGPVQVNGLPTGRVTATIGPGGSPSYVIHESVAWDAIAWTARLADLARDADCVAVGSLSQRSPVTRATVQRFLGSVRPGCLRVFDLNLRDPHHDAEVLAQTLPSTDLLKLNDDEWPFVARHLGLEPAWPVGLRQLMARTSLRWIALTRGEHGSVILDRRSAHELPGTPVDVVDTIGAGDAFTATLAMALLRGHDVATAHRAAAAVSAYVCTQSGGTPVLPPHLLDLIPAPARPAGVSVHLADFAGAGRRSPLPAH